MCGLLSDMTFHGIRLEAGEYRNIKIVRATTTPRKWEVSLDERHSGGVVGIGREAGTWQSSLEKSWHTAFALQGSRLRQTIPMQAT